MGGQGASGRRRSRVPVDHLAAAPAREPHQVPLGPTFGEPLMGEHVTELVRMKVLEPSLGGSAAGNLSDAAWRERTLRPEPERVRVRFGVGPPDAEVAVQCLRGSVPDPDVPRSSALRLGQQQREPI